MFDRETKREKILEGRLREMKLKEKQEVEQNAKMDHNVSPSVCNLILFIKVFCHSSVYF